MNCDRVMFTGHAVQRMFERRIQKEQIRDLLQSGEVIAEYPSDFFAQFFALRILGGPSDSYRCRV